MSNQQTNNTWKADQMHSEAGFTISHLGISKMSGFFKNFDISIQSEKEDFSDASVEATIHIGSLDTRVADRDHHLKESDFFDTENFPIAIVKGKVVSRINENSYVLEADVTIKGITKKANLDFNFRGEAFNQMSQKQTAGFYLSGNLNRKDFGIASNIPGIVLSENVNLKFDGEFVKS